MQASPDKDIVIFASSDMTHFQPKNPRNPKEEIDSKQKKHDQAVIDAFSANNWKDVYKKATETSVCGPQTITTLMILANSLGFNKTQALTYYTSFGKREEEIPCDYSVGYFAGIMQR